MTDFVPVLFHRQKAFTLVELLVSMTVLAMIMLVSATVISETQRTWTRGSARTEQFREARVAFEAITQNLRQATLNPYTTYQYPNGTTVPSEKTDAPQAYVRHSELQFVSGPAAGMLAGASAPVTPLHAVFFQAPLGISHRTGYEGLSDLLCSRGYFIAYGPDTGWRPPHVGGRQHRYRLMEYRPPSERNAIYSAAPGMWYTEALSQGVTATETADRPAYTRPVAENIVALILSPRVATHNLSGGGGVPTWIAPSYEYDSILPGAVGGSGAASALPPDPQGTQHLLPPIVLVTLVAIDEVSAKRLEEKHGANPPDLVAPGLFANVDNYQEDLEALQESLITKKLTYRVFTSAVALRNAKWKNL